MGLVNGLLKWVRISKGVDSSGPFNKQQIEYNGKTADAIAAYPYGVFANPPVDTLAVAGSVNNNSENRIIIVCSSPNSPDLANGEVAMYNPVNGSIVKMSANGDVDITAPNVTINGNVSISGNLSVNSKDYLTHAHAILGGSSAPGPTDVVT